MKLRSSSYVTRENAHARARSHTHTHTHTHTQTQTQIHTHTHMQRAPEVGSVGHAEGASYAFLSYANQSASKVDACNLLPHVPQRKLSLVP